MSDYEKYRFTTANDADIRHHGLSESHLRGVSDGPPAGYDHGK